MLSPQTAALEVPSSRGFLPPDAPVFETVNAFQVAAVGPGVQSWVMSVSDTEWRGFWFTEPGFGGAPNQNIVSGIGKTVQQVRDEINALPAWACTQPINATGPELWPLMDNLSPSSPVVPPQQAQLTLTRPV